MTKNLLSILSSNREREMYNNMTIGSKSRPDVVYCCWCLTAKRGAVGSLMTQFPKFRFIKRDVGSIEFHSDAGCKSFTSTFVSFPFFCCCIFCLPRLLFCLRSFSNVSFACSPFCTDTHFMTGDIITPPRLVLLMDRHWLPVTNASPNEITSFITDLFQTKHHPKKERKEQQKNPARIRMMKSFVCLFFSPLL